VEYSSRRADGHLSSHPIRRARARTIAGQGSSHGICARITEETASSLHPSSCLREESDRVAERGWGRVESGDSAILARRVHTSAPEEVQVASTVCVYRSQQFVHERTPGRGRVRRRGGGGGGGGPRGDERVGAAVEAPRSTAERANTCVPFERACRQRGLRACTSTLGVRHDNTG